MTFSVSRDYGLFEWGTNLDAIFCQRKNIFSPKMWRMIFDIIRFNQFSLDLLIEDDEASVVATPPNWNRRNGAADGLPRKKRRGETIGEFLEREGYSDIFRDDYLIPMTAALWNTGPDKCALDFPVVTLVRFL